MTNCERCGCETLTTTMSWFNTEMICKECDTKEQNHPQFEEARKRESAECMKGNLNFEGIGKPADL